MVKEEQKFAFCPPYGYRQCNAERRTDQSQMQLGWKL